MRPGEFPKVQEPYKPKDTLDVVVYIGSFTELGIVISTSMQRDKLEKFMTTKSYVGVNRVTDTFAAWTILDSIHGARIAGHRQPQSGASGWEWAHFQ